MINKEKPKPQSKLQQQETSSLNFKIQALLVFALAFVLYANTISHDYAVDDTIVITKNTLTTKGFNGIPQIMTTDAFYGFFGEGYKLVEGGRYRPLSIVTFAIENQLFGTVIKTAEGKPILDKDGDKNYTGNPHISHFINVVLFGLTGVLIFYLFALLLGVSVPSAFAWNIPFLAALLFVAHPIHTEAVANIKGRDEVLGMLGALLTLYFAVLYVKREKTVFLLLTFVCWTLALFSKENEITYLAVVPLTFYFFTKADVKKYALVVVPMLVLTVMYVLLRKKFTDLEIGQTSPEILNNPFVYATAADKFATIAFSFGEYIRLLLFPHPLTHDYYFNQVPIISWGNWKALVPLFINLAIIAYAIKGFFSKNIFAYAILYYYITMSIISNIPFTVGIVLNERFLFLASLGFCLILATLLVQLTNYFKEKTWDYKTILNPQLITIIVAMILAGYSFKTIMRNQDWKDDFTLFKADAKNSPNSAKIHNALGGEYLTQSDKPGVDAKTKDEYVKEAERVLTRAITIYPEYMNALLLLGNAKYKLYDSLPEAMYYYKKTLEMKPTYFEGNFNLGCVLIEKNKAKESIPYFKKAISSKPEKFEPYYNLAEAYFKTEQPDSAINVFRRVIALSHDRTRQASCYYKIGMSYGKMKNDLDNAILNLTKATELDPVNVVYYEDLGVAYGFKQDYQSAIRVLEKAIQINPKYSKIYYNLGVTYRQLGQEEKAQEYFAKGQEIEQGAK
ncbi:MAG: tetratricopeptide repeat protein [Chitinophagales bacterium]|nr:tetratricopeptide repeat protein [Chitinophagales bacterium]